MNGPDIIQEFGFDPSLPGLTRLLNSQRQMGIEIVSLIAYVLNINIIFIKSVIVKNEIHNVEYTVDNAAFDATKDTIFIFWNGESGGMGADAGHFTTMYLEQGGRNYYVFGSAHPLVQQVLAMRS